MLWDSATRRDVPLHVHSELLGVNDIANRVASLHPVSLLYLESKAEILFIISVLMVSADARTHVRRLEAQTKGFLPFWEHF